MQPPPETGAAFSLILHHARVRNTMPDYSDSISIVSCFVVAISNHHYIINGCMDEARCMQTGAIVWLWCGFIIIMTVLRCARYLALGRCFLRILFLLQQHLVH